MRYKLILHPILIEHEQEGTINIIKRHAYIKIKMFL